jgi:uridine phosphorylase
MAKQPHLLVSEGDLRDVALLPGDPDRVDRIANRCESVHLASAAVAVEELAAVGVRTMIRPGTTGALQRDIEIGDMVIATGAAKDEGTTKRYEAVEYPAVPDYEVLSALVDAASADEGDVHVGPIATDDAFYAEDEAYFTDREAAGILAVEMEAAALFALARRKGLRAGAICTVDGNLVEGTQKGETEEEELPPKARNNVARMIDIALEAAAGLD